MTQEEPQRPQNIAQQIFQDLRAQILRGKLPAGERLLGERELATKYGTNRNTLREAVRRLEQARLVSVRHGRGVTVMDFRRTGTPELLSPYLEAGPELGEIADIIEDVLEPRILLLEYAARLAVRRAEPADIERLRDIGELLVPAFEAGDAVVVARGFSRWLDALVDAGHSVSVRWIANSLFEALRKTLERFPNLWILEPSFPLYLRGVLQALMERNEDQAAAATRRYYERVDKQLMSLLRALSGASAHANREQTGREPGATRPASPSPPSSDKSRGDTDERTGAAPPAPEA